MDLINYSKGGNNYILKGNSHNRWMGYQASVIDRLVKKYGDNFNIVLWANESANNDYYTLPFGVVKHLFIESNKQGGKYPNRWTSKIRGSILYLGESTFDISPFYKYQPNEQVLREGDNDTYIENAKAEINIRIGQSKFRDGVLKNFNGKCALSGIFETELLIASHIVPWSHKKDYRGDIANGICLYCEYDRWFDKGYITFSDELEVIITEEQVSAQLRQKMNTITGKKLSNPSAVNISKQYLSYHRENIFIK